MFCPLLLLLSLTSSALGQVIQPDKPSPSAQDFSKQAYVIEHIGRRIRMESDGTGSRELTARVRMLADAGVKAFAVLTFVYTSANEAVDVDYVRVHKPDGTVVNTPDYNIQDMPGEVSRTAPLYSDIHEKHVAVKGLGVGDVLEYLVRVRVIKPEVPDQFWFEYSFAKDAIVENEQLELDVPTGKFVKIVCPEFKPEIKEENGRKIYHWTHSNLIVKEKDPDEVPRRMQPTPDVQITTFASWEDIGRWYAGLQKDALQITPAIQAKATELTKGLKTDDDKIHAIYNFVSLKFHYIGLDFGIGRYQPHAADDVLDNGYGDCKDKHTLLAALLKAAGYDAWPALVRTDREIDPDVPSPAQFNHVITVVPRGNSLIWLDTTPEVAPYRLILLGLRDKEALVIPTNTTAQLMRTPANSPEPEVQEFSIQGKLGGDGTFTAHVEQTYQGDTEVVFRAALRQTPEAEWPQLMQRISRAMNFGGDVSNVKATAPDDLDKPLLISYDYVRKNFGDWDNHHTTAPLPPFGIEAFKEVKQKKPPEPVLLGSVGKVVYRSRVELPKEYKVTPPAPVVLAKPYAEYSGLTRVEDGVMTTVRELKIKQARVPLSDWEEYRNFCIAIADDEYSQLNLVATDKSAPDKVGAEGAKTDAATPNRGDLDSMFVDGTNALQQRDFDGAREIFEKIIAKDPNYKGAHFNLGMAMAARNDFPEAIEQFRNEERVSPTDARAYQIVASFLTRTGRRNEAMDEWRTLLKVAPDNRTAASALAGLLYESEKYPEAVSVLETAIKASPDSSTLQMQLGSAYLKTGQKDKAVASFRSALEQKSDDPGILNNVSYTLAENNLQLDLALEYAKKAIAKLDEQLKSDSSDEAELRTTYMYSLVWDTLGWVYFQRGDTKQAEDWIRPAWLLGEESVVAEHLGEVYEKEGRRQEAARSYLNALAISPAPTGIQLFQNDAMKTYQDQTRAMANRYRKLTGKEPPLQETRRLPNGEWTQTPAEQLVHSRELKVTNEKKLSGRAQFLVTFKSGTATSVHYRSGDENLTGLSTQLRAVRYPFVFPPDENAIISVQVDVLCNSGSTCSAKLVNPLPPAARSRVNTE